MSGGILSNFVGGMIGGDQADMGTGILGNMNNYMTNNAGTLLGFGAGMLAGDNSLAAQGAMQGMQADQRTRLLQRKQAEEEQQRVAMQRAAQKLGIDPVLAQASPELIGTLAARQYAPKEQAKPNWGVIGQDDYGNNQYGWIDTASRSITPYQAAPQPQSYAPQAPDAVSIPPAPSGVNPKVWRDEQTKRLATEGKPTEKMRTDLALAERTAATLKAELKEFNAQVQQTGAEVLPTEAKARLQTKFTNIQMQLKNLYELGAITGPDMELIGKILTDPTVTAYDPREWGKGFNQAGRTKVQVDELEKIIDRSLENARGALGGSAPQHANPRANDLKQKYGLE